MYDYTVGDTIELYERNYRRLLEVLPQLPELRGSVSLQVGGDQELRLDVIERGAYTTLLALHYRFGAGEPWVIDPHMTVRLYHDAKVAEVIAYQQHQRFRSTYPYPNPQMLGRREKRQVNLFLAEWLAHCTAQGLSVLASPNFTNV